MHVFGVIGETQKREEKQHMKGTHWRWTPCPENGGISVVLPLLAPANELLAVTVINLMFSKKINRKASAKVVLGRDVDEDICPNNGGN
jgi:hypothetical protein